MDKRYLIKEIRERKENEFLFGCSERIVASSEFNRLLRWFKDFGFSIKYMDERTLPKDHHGDRLVGYTIQKNNLMEKENDNE